MTADEVTPKKINSELPGSWSPVNLVLSYCHQCIMCALGKMDTNRKIATMPHVLDARSQ